MLDFQNVLGQKSTDPGLWEFFNVEPIKLDKTDRGTNDNYGSMIYKDKGLELIFGLMGDEIVLNFIWLYNSEVFDQVAAYRDVFPKNLAFELSPNDVENKLGKPLRSVEKYKHPLFGDIPQSFFYNFEREYSVNMAFDGRGIMRFCISYPEVEEF